MSYDKEVKDAFECAGRIVLTHFVRREVIPLDRRILQAAVSTSSLVANDGKCVLRASFADAYEACIRWDMWVKQDWVEDFAYPLNWWEAVKERFLMRLVGWGWLKPVARHRVIMKRMGAYPEIPYNGCRLKAIPIFTQDSFVERDNDHLE